MIPKRIIDYHAVKNGMTHTQSEQIFQRLEIFLKNASKTEKSTPQIDVDEAWHTFILHTKYYYEYCFVNFNRFIHHNPHPITLQNSCDAGGQQRAKCNDEDEDKCEAGFGPKNLAHCDDAGESGRCDAQLQEILIANEYV